MLAHENMSIFALSHVAEIVKGEEKIFLCLLIGMQIGLSYKYFTHKKILWEAKCHSVMLNKQEKKVQFKAYYVNFHIIEKLLKRMYMYMPEQRFIVFFY